MIAHFTTYTKRCILLIGSFLILITSSDASIGCHQIVEFQQQNPTVGVDEQFLTSIRTAFYDLNSGAKIDEFIQSIDAGPFHVETRGYRAVAVMKKAKYALWPLTKLAFFREGKGALEELIKNYPSNVELRFQRILVQTQIPSFLGYSNDIDGDMRFLLANIQQVKTSATFKEQMFDALKSIDSLQPYFK